MKKNCKMTLLAMVVLLLTVAFPGSALALNTLEKPADALAAQAMAHYDASHEVLILKDVDPWRFPANEQVLRELNIPFSVAGTAEMNGVDPNDFKLIIVASDQPQAFYNAFEANFSKFDSFVRNGGLLQFNAADKGWETGFWNRIPGGVTHKKLYDETNYVINEDHPFVQNVPSSFTGEYASHGHFVNPPEQTTMITRDRAGVQTTMLYGVGSGKVIASSVALESIYGWQWDAKQMLPNIIKWALDEKGIVPCQQVIDVDPDEMPVVTLKTGETANRTLTIFNRGCNNLSFELEIHNVNDMDAAMAKHDLAIKPNDVEGSEVPPNGFLAEGVEEHIDAGNDVLIFKDVNPWRETSNETILQDLNVPYCVARSDKMGSLDLSAYKMIVVASDQPQSFYDRFDAQLSKFENFVSNGGTLVFNGADEGWQTGSWKELPGGVTHELIYDRNNEVINSDHPFVDGVSQAFTGNYASHDHFLHVPEKTTMIVRDEKDRLQTVIEYELGDGRIIASGVTLEASYAWGWEGGKILVNILRNALGDIPKPLNWLTADPMSGSIGEGGSHVIDLTYNATGLSKGIYKADIVIKSNDPINPTVKVRAVLEVTGGTCPKADHQDVSACINESKTIVLTANDAEGDSLTFQVVDGPQHGALSGSAPNLQYAPDPFYVGADAFTFKASDGNCDSNIATVSITVEGAALDVTPAAIHKNLSPGDTIEETLKLTNKGCGPITYKTELKEIESPKGLDMLGGPSEPVIIEEIPPEAEYVPGEMIVKYVANANENEVYGLLNNLGAMVAEEMPELNMEVWKFPVEGLNAEEIMVDAVGILSENPNILYAEPNYIYRAFGEPDDPLFKNLWGLYNNKQANCMYDGPDPGEQGADISALGAWERFTTGSRDVVVAVIDSGVDYNHDDLKNNIWMNDDETPGNGKDDDGNGFVDDVYGYDFSYNDGDPMDENKHGTHCAGTIGAEGNNDLGVVGVCHSVRIMPVRFLDEFGSGSTDSAVKAILYAVDNGAHILNNSWGGGGFSNALKEAIAYANDHDVLFVAAAGNSARDNDKYPHYPSSYDVPNVLAVAATDCQDYMASFSCYGAESVDLGAPGVKIISAVPGNQYKALNGTSMATPHVSGAAALLKAYKPDLTALEIKDILMNTVDIKDDLVGKTLTGGRLNVERALEAVGSGEWISLDGQVEGVLQPGESVDLKVTLDATGNKPGGEYTADIATSISDDPDHPLNVVTPVRMVIGGQERTLKITGQGEGQVKVNGNLHDLPWEGTFQNGVKVNLEAIPNQPDWWFEKWTGVDPGKEGSNPVSLTMDANKTISTVFSNAQTVKLTVNGNGQVQINGEAKKLPWNGDFPEGDKVRLEALPAEQFKEWAGDYQSEENPAEIPMDKDKQVRAVFNFQENWQLTIHAQGEDIGGAGVDYEEYLVLGDEAPLVNKYKVTIGVGSPATTVPAPPAPPEYTVKIELYSLDWDGPFFKDIREPGQESYKWVLAVNPHGNVQPPTDRTAIVSWNPDELNPSGQYRITNEGGDVIVPDMRETIEFEVTGGNSDQFFTIEKVEGAFNLALDSGWNMVSLPLMPDDARAGAVFPDAEAIYRFVDGMYELVESDDLLQPHVGYWVKTPADRIYNLVGGEAIRNYALDLGEGWHIIGAPYGEARPEPADRIEVIYCFDDAYYEARKLVRGHGCWVKLKAAGKINVNAE